MVVHFQLDSPRPAKNKAFGKKKSLDTASSPSSCTAKPYAKAMAFLDAVTNQREREAKKVKEIATDELDDVYESDWSHLAKCLRQSPPPSPAQRRQLGKGTKEMRGRSPDGSPRPNLNELPARAGMMTKKVELIPPKPTTWSHSPMAKKFSNVSQRSAETSGMYSAVESPTLSSPDPRLTFISLLNAEEDAGQRQRASSSSSVIKDPADVPSVISETSTKDSPDKHVLKENHNEQVGGRIQRATWNHAPVIRNPSDLSMLSPVMSESSTMFSPDKTRVSTKSTEDGSVFNSMYANTTSAFASASPAITPAASSVITPVTTPCITTSPFQTSQCDTSLVPPTQQAEYDGWKGWVPVPESGGSIFFYHVPSETSVWEQPPELSEVLGEWEMIEETEDQSGPYWHNALLQASVWRDPTQVTNIFQASKDNNIVFLQLYAHVDGDFDAADGKGRRALHYACASGSVQACQMLINFKATLDAPDNNRASPLLFAARYGYSNLCRLLIDSRASVNVRNSLGDSCLHEAAQLGQTDCVVLLLLVKADCESKNHRNLRPEDVARANHHTECVQILHRDSMKRQKLADYGDEAEESGVSFSSGESEVESEESEDEKPNVLKTPNRTTQNFVQKMQPLLKGVQGAVNTLFPIKADLGMENRFQFDHQLNEWVLR